MIRSILEIQKRELKKKVGENYIGRGIKPKIFESDLIKVIIGPRRAGKSFFAIHTLAKLGSVGYVNFDDEKLTEVKDYNEITNTLNSIYINPKYLLFDEIQNLDKMHDILENLNIENKEKLSQIQRNIERNSFNVEE